MLLRSVAAIAMTLATISAAGADTLVAGPLYQGAPSFTNVDTVTCRLFNYGTKPVSVTHARIYDNTGKNISVNTSGCLPSLAAKKSCAISTSYSGNLAFSCMFITSGTTTLTGTFEAQNDDFFVTEVIPLQRMP